MLGFESSMFSRVFRRTGCFEHLFDCEQAVLEVAFFSFFFFSTIYQFLPYFVILCPILSYFALFRHTFTIPIGPLATLHLNGKNLPTKSSRDFEGGLDTIGHFWFDPEFFLAHNSSGCGAIYNSSKSKVQKVVKMKKEHHFYFKNF